MAKASDTEEEYFARENAERLRKLAAEQKKSLADAEREKLRKLHHMRCPKCGMELQEISVRGVQVDRCFSCHKLQAQQDFVWTLDRMKSAK